eukprot:scaffold118427_cov18-Tisochrysis_lutea.AAC.5
MVLNVPVCRIVDIKFHASPGDAGGNSRSWKQRKVCRAACGLKGTLVVCLIAAETLSDRLSLRDQGSSILSAALAAGFDFHVQQRDAYGNSCGDKSLTPPLAGLATSCINTC